MRIQILPGCKIMKSRFVLTTLFTIQIKSVFKEMFPKRLITIWMSCASGIDELFAREKDHFCDGTESAAFLLKNGKEWGFSDF